MSKIDDLFNEAERKPGVKIPVGDVVVCDFCDEDYTTSKDGGGLVFDGNGVCPKCALKLLDDAERYGELEHIKAVCPVGKSFADFIREYRGPNAFISVTGF
jgi:hypothetical protein